MKFNNEDLNLTILMEECAEVIQVCSKIKRFGIDDFHPKEKEINRNVLERELGDLMCMAAILVKQGTIQEANIEQASLNKLKKLERWYEI